MNTLIFFILLLVWCLLFAKLETEIEGSHGWAEKLPTARYHYIPILDFLYYKEFAEIFLSAPIPIEERTLKHKIIIKYIGILGGKDFTVYHRVIDLIQLLVAHLIVYSCFRGLEPVLVLEIRAFASLFLIWSIEDNLLFYINPKAKESDHHQEWIMIGDKRLMDKGMLINFIIGCVLMPVSFII